MGKAIPASSRRTVIDREHGRCARCGGQGSAWHHRRSRSVRDAHTHCACNGVWLCNTCHTWAHAHPVEARETGFIVTRYQPEPGLVAFRTLAGWAYPTCAGTLITQVMEPKETL